MKPIDQRPRRTAVLLFVIVGATSAGLVVPALAQQSPNPASPGGAFGQTHSGNYPAQSWFGPGPTGAGSEQIDLGNYTLALNKANSQWTLTNKQTGARTDISGDDAFNDCQSYAGGAGAAGAVSQAYDALAPGHAGIADDLNSAAQGCNAIANQNARSTEDDLRRREEALRQQEQELQDREAALQQREQALARREEDERRREQSQGSHGPTFVIPIPGFGGGSRNGGQGQGSGQSPGNGQGQGKNCHTNPVTGQYHCE
jgi:hypothetical protein